MLFEDSIVAILDDEASVRRALERLVRAFSFRCMLLATGEALLAGVAAQRPDCIILDLQLPGLQGLEVVQRPSGGGLEWLRPQCVGASGAGGQHTLAIGS